MQSWRRLIGGLAAIAAMLVAVVFVSTAAAGPPEKSEFSNIAFSSVLSDVCPFDVNVDSVVSGFEIDYFDSAGNITRAQIHQVEQDTFSANGKTLTGLVEKIVLPDGSLFVSAGWVDFADHPGVTFILSPDKGNPGNVAGFCAALAP